jgi:hypothetical protein
MDENENKELINKKVDGSKFQTKANENFLDQGGGMIRSGFMSKYAQVCKN